MLTDLSTGRIILLLDDGPSEYNSVSLFYFAIGVLAHREKESSLPSNVAFSVR